MSALDDARRMRMARMALSMAATAMNETLRCPRTFLERCFALRDDINELVEQFDASARREMRAALAPKRRKRGRR